ncbi:hypothetical protein DCC39_18070 [Pueribacillus theae]|uniref:Uncharacterized protein n=1 Tax=Pueribacillus theae TaxID=2171751 RepID=A0A2U1JKT6_9BACI|nr:hypothetical protein [Pueribacillus theae]PWA05493.1 hypothetical protein DCC39_18070 [Pueribacillus theae]
MRYEFRETSSNAVEQDGQHFRRVYFTGGDSTGELTINGYIPMVPALEYFQAGIDGTINDLIREHVMTKLTGAE